MENNLSNEVSPMEISYKPCIYMPKLAHAYVPFQCMTDIYPPMVGLNQGTIFPELDMPYGVDPEYTLDA
jgi:hypothetical protein